MKKLLFLLLCLVFGIGSGIFCIEAWADKSGVGPTVLSLPSGPGSIGGVGENVQANLNMGLMSYSIKVIVPKGRGETTPEVSISYSSSAGAGMMGIGWGFNAGGNIERLTVRGLPTYTNNDRFYASGELVKIPNTPFYRARIEGMFARYRWIQKDNNDQKGYWLVEYPDGSKGYYGANHKGELDLESQVYGLQGTFRWELRTSIDRNGNRIEYTYAKDGTQTYLDQISWVFDKSNKPLYRMRFQYEDRPDPISDGKPGFDLQTLKRLKELEITSDGQRFRSYSFAYEDSTGLSRLIKATRYGRDPQKPFPVAFSMKYSDATFSTTNSRLVQMPTSLGIDFATGKADFLDINGDGLPDVIDTTQSKHVFHINTLGLDEKLEQKSHDFPASKKITNPDATSGAQLSSASVQLLDYNGDGFTDMVDAVNKVIYINKGNGKWENSQASLQSFPVDGKDANMRFFDYNGDKAIDVISSNGSTTTYWVSDGKGDWKQVDGKPNLGVSISQDRIRFIDINGDGLNDAVQILPKNMRYKKYLGYGNWSEWIDVKVPQIEKYELSTKAQFNDINGDGMADMVAFLGNSIVYFVNKNGKEFEEPKIIQDFGGQSIPNSTQSSVRIADMNGNGSRDIVWIDSNGRVTYLELFNQRPNLLTEISNGIGQRIQVTYGSSVYHKLRDDTCDPKQDKACAGSWLRKLPMAFTVVNVIQTWAEQKTGENAAEAKAPRVQRIYYHDGFYDGNEKKFRGFRHVQSVHDGDDSAGTRQDENIYNVGDQDIYFHGKLLSSTVSDGKNHVYHKVTMEWKDCGVPKGAVPNLDPPVRFICQTSQEKQIMEGLSDNARWKTIRYEIEYDGYGNVTSHTALGDISKEGDEKYVRRQFIDPGDPNSPDTKWFLRLLQHSEVCESSKGPCVRIHNYYDGEAYQGMPAGQFTVGNLTRASVQASDAGPDIHLRRFQYDSYGNTTGAKDPNGSLRTIEWDSQFSRFGTQEIIHLDSYTMSIAMQWDTRFSAIQHSTDMNGRVSQYRYDEFGREVATILPLGNPDKPSIRYEYDMKSPLSRIITHKRSQKDGEEDQKTIICYDGLGRKLQERRLIEKGRYLVTSFVRYNRLNQVAERWNTFESSQEECAFAPTENIPSVQFFYDGLGRSIKAIKQNKATVRYVFEPFKSMHYDEEDNRSDSPHFNTPTTLVRDGLDRVVEKIEFKDPQKQLTTRYKWSFLNSSGEDMLVSVTDPGGHVKSQTIDYLGRITKVVDPDRKNLTYTYDAASNLLQRKDEEGRVVSFTYDALNRVKTIQEEGKPETKIEHFYDTPHPGLAGENLKGKPVAILYPGGQDHFSYNENGQMTVHQRHLLGTKFTFTYTYDDINRMLTKTYPDGRKISAAYDGISRLTSLSPMITKMEYGANGFLKRYTNANQTETAVTYDNENQIERIMVDNGDVLDLKYTYDAIGNIMTIKDSRIKQEENQSFQYNAMYQLTSATLGAETLTYTYDDIDNITSKMSSLKEKSFVHLGEYQYDAQRPRAVLKAAGLQFAYDKAGHLVQHGGMQFKKDFLGRRTHTLSGQTEVGRYWYGPALNDTDDVSGSDAFLRRTIKMEQGLYTLYVSADYEIRGKSATIYTRLGRRKISAWSQDNMIATVFDDLAPAEGNDKLTAKPDQKISAADAWLYHATKTKQITMTLRERPIDVDLTRSMLDISAQRLLEATAEDKVYFHHNHQDSIVLVTNEKKEVIAQTYYYPFGAARKTIGQVFPYSYTGLELDRATNHHYAHSRYLDARLSRWMSADRHFDHITSIQDELNSYTYVRNSPMQFIDSDGTMSKGTKALIFGLVGMASGAAWLAGTLEAGSGAGYTANIVASTTAAAAGILAAIGVVAKGKTGTAVGIAGGLVGIGSGVAWIAATHQSSSGDHDSKAAIANYAASGLAVLAGAVALYSTRVSDGKKAGKLAVASGAMVAASGIAWAIGTDTGDKGGSANMIGAALSIVAGVASIAYGLGKIMKAGGLSGLKNRLTRQSRFNATVKRIMSRNNSMKLQVKKRPR